MSETPTNDIPQGPSTQTKLSELKKEELGHGRSTSQTGIIKSVWDQNQFHNQKSNKNVNKVTASSENNYGAIIEETNGDEEGDGCKSAIANSLKENSEENQASSPSPQKPNMSRIHSPSHAGSSNREQNKDLKAVGE